MTLLQYLLGFMVDVYTAEVLDLWWMSIYIHTVDLAYKPISLKCSTHNINYTYIYIFQYLFYDDLIILIIIIVIIIISHWMNFS